MKDAEILSRLQDVFDDVFFDEVSVTPELSAHDVEEWDSLTHITLIVAIEKDFDIRFATGEVEATEDVAGLMALIERRLSGG